MDLESLLTLFVASLILAIKPGPHFLATVSLAADGKWKDMIIFWCSAVLSASVNYFILLKGLVLLPEGLGLVFIFIKAAAACLFVTMGFIGLKRASLIDYKAVQSRKEIIEKADFLKNMGAGILTAFSNPYSILFILTAVPTIMGTLEYSFFDIAVIRSVVIAADLVILPLFCLPLLFVRNYLSDAIIIKLRYISAVSMILIGLYFFMSMITQWDLYKSGLL